MRRLKYRHLCEVTPRVKEHTTSILSCVRSVSPLFRSSTHTSGSSGRESIRLTPRFIPTSGRLASAPTNKHLLEHPICIYIPTLIITIPTTMVSYAYPPGSANIKNLLHSRCDEIPLPFAASSFERTRTGEEQKA